MGVRESLLNTITSVADSDFVRIVTSAGASSKATVRNLFKGFESNLSAKSSLTTSDYIRVVGSDNEAYKQSVNSVKSTLGVTALEAEVDALNSKIVWNMTTDLALTNCQKYNDIGVRYAVVGNMCHVYISISNLTANSRVKIATLPSGARPLTNTQYLGGGGLSYTNKSYFTFGSDGAVYVISDDTYAMGYTNFIVKQ